MDLEKYLIKKIGEIDSEVLKVYFLSLFVTVLSFSIFTFHYLMHDHGLFLPWIWTGDQLFSARWLAPFWFLLSSYTDVPVFIPFFSSALNVLSAMMVLGLWVEYSGLRITKTASVFVILMMTISPNIMEMYYFTWMGLILSGSIFFAVLAIKFSLRSGKRNFIFATLLAFSSIAGYQPCFSVLTTLFMTILLFLFVNWIKGKVLATEIAFKMFKVFSVIVLSVFLYRISFSLFDYSVGTTYVTKQVELSHVYNRIIEVTETSFRSLFVTHPQYSIFLRVLQFFVVVLGFFFFCLSCVSYRKIPRYVSLLGASILFSLFVLSTKAMFYVSPSNDFLSFRYNFSLIFFFSFFSFCAFVFSKNIFSKNLAFLVSFLIVFSFVKSVLTNQGVLMRAQKHDLAFNNRILSRIESLDGVDYQKKYNLILIGGFEYNKKILAGIKFESLAPGSIYHTQICGAWCSGAVMDFLGSKIKFHHYLSEPVIQMDEARRVVKEQHRQSWPHQSSVFIHDDSIIVNLESSVL